MSEPFLAEVRIVGFNFAPRGWALCDGQILPINQNQSLYSLLGTTYGGDGRTTFALPDLRGRVPIHVDGAHREGQKSGEETHTLSVQEMPQHKHAFIGSTAAGTVAAAVSNVLAQSPNPFYHEATNLVNMNGATIAHSGGSQTHENMQPSLALNFCIALQGLFPSRN